MRYTICDVRVSELLTKQVSIPPWEVAVLQAIHGDNVKVVGEEEIDRDPPSPQDEYQRLVNKYRGNKEDAQSVAALVYGPFDAGVSKIMEGMRESGIDVEEYSYGRRERAVPARRSSRMSVGVRSQQARRELDAQTLRTTGTPNRVSLSPAPTGVAPSNADPRLGEDIGQQSKLRRAERQQQQQGLQPNTPQSRNQTLQRSVQTQPLRPSGPVQAQALEQRKQEARQARERFLSSQSSQAPGVARGRSSAPVRPR